MSSLIDVIVPGPWWNALTYEAERDLTSGVRVRVPVRRGLRVGFVLGPVAVRPNFEIRPVKEVLDAQPVLDDDLWDLALWMGRAWLCGAGLALDAMCPPPLLNGEPLPPPLSGERTEGTFRESLCFDPRDGKRGEFYLQKIQEEGRSLVLFPEAQMAKRFFSSLPESLRSEALLWPSTGGKKLWDAWNAVRSGKVRVVVAPPGGAFAPLRPDRILVEEEASLAYVFQRFPRVHARSLAGHRASFLGAELALGGIIPSAKTFLRGSTVCEIVPDRKKVVFVDMGHSIKEKERGVEGSLPLTISLLDRTRQELGAGRHVLWVLDRRGEAAEVFCAECGHAVRCPRCGGVMRAEQESPQVGEEGGKRLRCVLCGMKAPLPDRCPACHGELWSGRRPGLEALSAMAARLVRGYPVLLHEAGKKLKTKGPSLILGTRGSLSLCDALDVGLAAWLDLDAELRRPEYGARFQAFSMVWESYWRGRGDTGPGRTVLIQSRRSGKAWRDALSQGWERFWKGELQSRSELDLPPYGLMVRIDASEGEDRGALISRLERAGLFVMDPGDEKEPLWVSSKSIAPVAAALAPRFEISRSREGFPAVTVLTE